MTETITYTAICIAILMYFVGIHKGKSMARPEPPTLTLNIPTKEIDLFERCLEIFKLDGRIINCEVADGFGIRIYILTFNRQYNCYFFGKLTSELNDQTI